MSQIDYANLTDFDRHVMLARMANFLEDLPSDRLHMPRWSAPDATEHSCGSAGCFAGWTATVHREGGWRFQHLQGWDDKFAFTCPVVGRRQFTTTSICGFFALSTGAAIALTQGDRWKVRGRVVLEEHDLETQTPRDVARRIRAVVAHIDPAALEAASTDKPAMEGATP